MDGLLIFGSSCDIMKLIELGKSMTGEYRVLNLCIIASIRLKFSLAWQSELVYSVTSNIRVSYVEIPSFKYLLFLVLQWILVLD